MVDKDAAYELKVIYLEESDSLDKASEEILGKASKLRELGFPLSVWSPITLAGIELKKASQSCRGAAPLLLSEAVLEKGHECLVTVIDRRLGRMASTSKGDDSDAAEAAGRG